MNHLTTAGSAEMPEALLNIAREIEALKRECGMDPESPVAIQNGRYMAISHKVRNLAAMLSAAQEDLAAMRAGGEPSFYVRTDEIAKLSSPRLAGLGVMLSKEPGIGRTACYTSPQPAAQDAERLDWLERAGPTSICLVMDRQHDGEIEVSPDDGPTGYGKTLRAAIDAAIAAQQGVKS